MSEELDFISTGRSAEECEDFIQAIRKHARVNGKVRDNLWNAEEVGNALNGKALRWYWKQTPEVQGDWKLLQKALVERWLDHDSDDYAQRQPSGANTPPPPPAQGPIPTPDTAAPSRNSNSLSGKTGRLRIRTGLLRASDMFLSKSTYFTGVDKWRLGAFLVTSDPKAAMHVKLMPAGDGLWQLEMLAHPSGRKLVAASFIDGDPETYGGFRVGVDIPYGTCLKDHDSTYFGGNGSGQFQTALWRLEDERYLTFVWSENVSDRAEKRIPIVWQKTEGLYIHSPHIGDDWNKQVEFEFEVFKD